MLFWGVLFICLAAWLYVVMFVSCRNPIPNKWVSDMKMFCLWAPLIIGLLALGVSLIALGFFSGTASIEIKDLALSFLVILSTIGAVRFIKPKQKLKLYSSQKQVA